MNVRLVMFRENGERRDFPLSSDATTIGRKDDCDIRIPLSDVSRQHATILLADGGVIVKDLGSVNGTYVNNRRVKKTERLAPGDRLVVGPVVFTVQIDGDPDDIRPVKTKLRHREPAGRSAVGLAAGGTGMGGAVEEEVDPISALEALASSADQTAIDPFADEDEDALA